MNVRRGTRKPVRSPVRRCQARSHGTPHRPVMRREIAHALRTRRRVVPIFRGGFSFPPAERLPRDIRELARMNGVE